MEDYPRWSNARVANQDHTVLGVLFSYFTVFLPSTLVRLDMARFTHSRDVQPRPSGSDVCAPGAN